MNGCIQGPNPTLRNTQDNRDRYLNATARTAVSIDARESRLWKVSGIKFRGLTNSNDFFLATRRLIEEGSSDLLKKNILLLAYISQKSPRCIKKANQLFHQKRQWSVLNCSLAPHKDAL